MMPRDQKHRRWVALAAPLAAEALQQGLERDVAAALDEQLHGQPSRSTAALKLDHAVRPVGQAVLDAEERRVHADSMA
jgi:hypothetical protein